MLNKEAAMWAAKNNMFIRKSTFYEKSNLNNNFRHWSNLGYKPPVWEQQKNMPRGLGLITISLKGNRTKISMGKG